MARASKYRSQLKWLKVGDDVPTNRCDVPGCDQLGDFRAPKSRDLNEYYNFCLEHVRRYNSSWDFLSGLSMMDIEHHVRAANTWERPTWRFGTNRHAEDKIRHKVHETFTGHRADPFVSAADELRRAQRQGRADTVEMRALAVLDLDPPVTFDAIKSRYKQLAKRHHPDMNGGSSESEERLKAINEAYTTLKNAFLTINMSA